jgi:hypothetical protein
MDWSRLFHSWAYGIRRYYEKKDIPPPESQTVQLLSKNQLEYFHDLRFAA